MSKSEATPARNRNDRDRNRRMFAGIQQSLGGPRSAPRTQKPQKKKGEPPVEVLDDLDSIIAQISDISIRPERSAAEIKRNIAASPVLSKLDEEEWDQLADCLINTALDANETDFVVGLLLPLMQYDEFCESLSGRLKSVSAAYVLDGDDDLREVPALLGAILCGNWPRHMNKAIENVNPILFSAVSLIKGWVEVLADDNQFYCSKPEVAKKIDESLEDEEEISDLENDEEKEEKEDEGPGTSLEGGVVVREDPETVNRCAAALCSICESTQRSLWMSWPDLCDEMYSAIKEAITHNTIVTGKVKSNLLHTLLLFHSWTQNRPKTMKNAVCQTISR